MQRRSWEEALDLERENLCESSALRLVPSPALVSYAVNSSQLQETPSSLRMERFSYLLCSSFPESCLPLCCLAPSNVLMKPTSRGKSFRASWATFCCCYHPQHPHCCCYCFALDRGWASPAAAAAHS